MEAQEFLYQTISELIPPVETLDSLKHVSRTDLIEISNFPAVIILEEPYDYNQDTGQNEIIMKTQNCTLSVIVQSVNVNEMNESSYMLVKGKLKVLTDEVISAILGKVPVTSKIANLKLGRGEVFDGIISSVPVMWNLIPVELKMVQ